MINHVLARMLLKMHLISCQIIIHLSNHPPVKKLITARLNKKIILMLHQIIFSDSISTKSHKNSMIYRLLYLVLFL